MYKDLHRIEDALLPCLFRHTIVCIVENHPESVSSYDASFDMLNATIEKCFDGLTDKKKKELRRRLNKIVRVIVDHFVNNEFRVMKMLLTLSQWATYMHLNDILRIDEDSEYFKFLLSIEEQAQNGGYGEMEDFAKIDASAIKHAPKVYAIAQQQGYYL